MGDKTLDDFGVVVGCKEVTPDFEFICWMPSFPMAVEKALELLKPDPTREVIIPPKDKHGRVSVWQKRA